MKTATWFIMQAVFVITFFPLLSSMNYACIPEILLKDFDKKFLFHLYLFKTKKSRKRFEASRS